MDPGEQTTGTRDEYYNLISVLYHALHGSENAEIYALDAEAAGDERLAGFFREAQEAQRGLAERAKGMLGIGEAPVGGGISPGGMAGGMPPETSPEVGAVSPDTISGGVPPRSDDVQREAQREADVPPPPREERSPRRDVPPDEPPPLV